MHAHIHECIPSIHPLIHGLSARWCPFFPHFLTSWVSRLLGCRRIQRGNSDLEPAREWMHSAIR